MKHLTEKSNALKLFNKLNESEEDSEIEEIYNNLQNELINCFGENIDLNLYIDEDDYKLEVEIITDEDKEFEKQGVIDAVRAYFPDAELESINISDNKNEIDEDFTLYLFDISIND